MGYCSEVGLVVTRDTDAKGTIGELLALAKLKDIDPMHHWGEKIEYNDTTLLFLVSDVKWYESFSEVRVIDDFKWFINDVDGFSFLFVRSGEELNDNEEEACGDDPPYGMLYVSKQMYADISITKPEATT